MEILSNVKSHSQRTRPRSGFLCVKLIGIESVETILLCAVRVVCKSGWDLYYIKLILQRRGDIYKVVKMEDNR